MASSETIRSLDPKNQVFDALRLDCYFSIKRRTRPGRIPLEKRRWRPPTEGPFKDDLCSQFSSVAGWHCPELSPSQLAWCRILPLQQLFVLENAKVKLEAAAASTGLRWDSLTLHFISARAYKKACTPHCYQCTFLPPMKIHLSSSYVICIFPIICWWTFDYQCNLWNFHQYTCVTLIHLADVLSSRWHFWCISMWKIRPMLHRYIMWFLDIFAAFWATG